MAQIVIEFGAPRLGPVMDAMFSLIGTPIAIETELLSGGAGTCPDAQDAFDFLSEKFTDGEIVAVTFRTGSEAVRYGLILRPRYGGQKLSSWLGTVELTTEDWRQYWDALLRFEALAFVCASDEEGVALTDCDLTLTSFPWDERQMLAGALRTGEGVTGWVIKERTTTRTVL